MALTPDISDLYIKSPTDPNYDENMIETTSFIDTVISKLYLILFTQRGEVFGQPNFGADIPKYLWKTKFPADQIKADIIQQISLYIPELSSNDYSVNVYILPSNTNYDIAVVSVNLGISSVNALFK